MNREDLIALADKPVIDGDGRVRPPTERERVARIVLYAIKNPEGIETIDWEIADAVIALRAQASSASTTEANPMTGLTQDDLLILLVEECGEVIQAATKCLRFGFDIDHNVNYGRNDLALAREVGDLTAVIDALKFDPFEMDKTYKAKITKAVEAKAMFGRIVRQNQ